MTSTAMLVALLVTGALAQNLPSMSGHPAHVPAPPVSAPRPTIGISGPPLFSERFRGSGFGHRRFARSPFFGYGVPYFYPDYYELDDGYQPAPPEPAPSAAPVAPAKNEPLPSPVLLELHGDQWVRVNDFKMPPSSASPAASAISPAIPKETLPAVLVYRDGHTEDVSSYSIIDDVIYTKANYWTEGAWTRKIAIASLDIPATLKQNQQRGVKFELPSGPNEVVIRP